MDLMPPQPQRIALLLCVSNVTTPPPAPAESADGAAEDEFTTTTKHIHFYITLSNFQLASRAAFVLNKCLNLKCSYLLFK